MRVGWRISWNLVLALLSGPGALAGEAYYLGTLKADDLVWEIGLHVPDSVREPPRCDVISHWSLDLPVSSYGRSGDRIHMTLPNGLGELSGALGDAAIVGTVKLPDGRAATAQLERKVLPDMSRENLTVRGDSVQLGATLGLPAGPGPFPAVVFVHGAGDSSREQAGTLFLAGYLPRYGIACLVCDKRGCGASTGNWREVGLAERADDALAAVAALRADRRIDPQRIGLFAGSQGSWVADIAAARDAQIAFVAHHSGPAVSVAEADDYAESRRLARLGLDATAIDEFVTLRQLEMSALRRGVPAAADAALQQALDRARARPWFATAPFEPSPVDHWWTAWYPKVMDHDPLPYLRLARCPMLWLYGSRDSQSDPLQNVSVLMRLARDEGKDYTIHVFPAAGHGIMVPLAADGSDVPPSTMAQGYFRTLIAWLAAR